MHQKILNVGMREELLMLVSSSDLEIHRSLFWGREVFTGFCLFFLFFAFNVHR